MSNPAPLSLPATNLKLAEQVETRFFRDTGPISLASTKCRDAVRKFTGSVSLSDFKNRAFTGGRTIVFSQLGGINKGNCADGRLGYSDPSLAPARCGIRIATTADSAQMNGYPVWGVEVYGLSSTPEASYTNGYFVCDRPNERHTLTFNYKKAPYNTAGSYLQYAVLGHTSGYLNGAENFYVPYAELPATTSWKTHSVSFTPVASYPHVTIITSVWTPVGTGGNAYAEFFSPEVIVG